MLRRWPYLLVVDDDADFRDGLRAALEMKGYQVDEAGNGKEALEKILAKAPLLVLLDLQMPVMNGRELLQRLRGAPETREIPVVIISGFGFEWEAELMGAQGYIGKPFEARELEKTIAQLLRPRLVSVRPAAVPEKEKQR
jgi:CheY-like chemotaxis protein